jgi:hypothetical protein
MPHLCQAVEDSRINGKAIVSEVVGDLAGAGLSEYIKLACAKKDKMVPVDEIRLAALSVEDRTRSFSDNGMSCWKPNNPSFLWLT